MRPAGGLRPGARLTAASGPRPEDVEGVDDPHLGCMEAVARARGLGTRRVRRADPRGREQEWLELRVGEARYFYRQGLLARAVTPGPDPAMAGVNRDFALISRNKDAVKRAAAARGVPVPEGRAFEREERAAAEAYFAGLKGPACVKANDGSRGRAVFPGVSDLDAFRQAFDAAARKGRVQVERHFEGRAVRFFFVHPRIVGVREDVPARVIGDGEATVRALMEAKTRARLERRPRFYKPLEDGPEVRATLARQGLDFEDVPARGREVWLARTSNIPTGGETLSFPERIHPSYSRAVERLCRSLKDCRVVAVDALLADPARPAAPDNYRLLEINSGPGVVPFYFPWEGRPQDVCGEILGFLEREERLRARVLRRLRSVPGRLRRLAVELLRRSSPRFAA